MTVPSSATVARPTSTLGLPINPPFTTRLEISLGPPISSSITSTCPFWFTITTLTVSPCVSVAFEATIGPEMVDETTTGRVCRFPSNAVRWPSV